MKENDRIRFTRDVLNWNGSAKKAHKGETGRITHVSANKAAVVKDGRVNTRWGVPMSAIELE